MGTLLLALTCSFHPAMAQEPKDPQDILQAFGAELIKGIKTTQDSALRTRLITAAKTVFTTDMKTAVCKVPKAKWDCHQQYLQNLITADKRYPDEDTKPERAAWMSACKTAFQFMTTHANEPETRVTTDEVFTELFAGIDKVRKDIPGASSADIRSAAYLGAKQVFTERLAKAIAPGRNPQSTYTEQLIKIDKTYPLPQAAPPPPQNATPSKASTASAGKSGKSSGAGGGSAPPPPKEDYDFHTEPNTILKSAAKVAFDKALVAPKQ